MEKLATIILISLNFIGIIYSRVQAIAQVESETEYG